jgi:histidyl-tRNA synthetase
MKSQMREADKHGVRYTLIIGESELNEKSVMVRDMQSGEQQEVKVDNLVLWLENAPG